MIALETTLRQVCRDLIAFEVRFALIGGLAVSPLAPSLALRATLTSPSRPKTTPVASVGHLSALKVLSRDDKNRPQDRADLEALLRVASTAELAGARDALTLIASRGYHRGKDLQSDFESLVRS